jgi:hypothetical protein
MHDKMPLNHNEQKAALRNTHITCDEAGELRMRQATPNYKFKPRLSANFISTSMGA